MKAKSIVIIVLLLSAQILEYGFSICYFCQWEILNICGCDMPQSQDSSSCCEEEDHSQSTEADSFSNSKQCFSCISVLPKIMYDQQILFLPDLPAKIMSFVSETPSRSTRVYSLLSCKTPPIVVLRI